MAIFLPDRIRTNCTHGVDMKKIMAVCTSTQPAMMPSGLPEANIDQSTSIVTIFLMTKTNATTVISVPISL